MLTETIVHKNFRQLPNIEFIGVVEDSVLIVYGITDERTRKAYLTGFGTDRDFKQFKSGYYLLINEMAYVTVGFGTLETINALENTHDTDKIEELSERDMRHLLNNLFDDTIH